jgi:hypothetical protein
MFRLLLPACDALHLCALQQLAGQVQSNYGMYGCSVLCVHVHDILP